MRRTILAVAALLSLTGVATACQPKSGVSEDTPSPTPATTPSRSVGDPIMISLGDCEDKKATPCVTFDEGEWRRVYSFDPYSATPLIQCEVEDGGPILPCVWKKRDQYGNWLVFIAPIR